MDQAWIDACRTYSALDEAGRLDYWSRLTEEQRATLTQALAELSVPPAAPVTPGNTIVLPAPSAAGCGKTLGIGCGGVVLGALLTIAIEIVAVYRGIDSLSRFFKEPTRTTPATPAYDIGHCGDQSARRIDRNFDTFCRANRRRD